MLIIDPEVDCARIYTEDYAGIIKGKPEVACKELASRLFAYDKDGMMVQIIEPRIVKGGVGDVYIYCLKNMGVTYKTVQLKASGIILPKFT